ncbi:MAG TPA: hypothetical protein PKC55_17565 [Dysgonomonas sp.]|nr:MULTISPECIES: hypothetical protein [Dysgonomonas]MBS5908595.1 hypothetical protein [Dysgonomonas mossii]MBS5979664.1 hypothetical protein [Dysgonomonas mossii]HML66638.1 hypothetical protein [Dysgonomonas sp.]
MDILRGGDHLGLLEAEALQPVITIQQIQQEVCLLLMVLVVQVAGI